MGFGLGLAASVVETAGACDWLFTALFPSFSLDSIDLNVAVFPFPSDMRFLLWSRQARTNFLQILIPMENNFHDNDATARRSTVDVAVSACLPEMMTSSRESAICLQPQSHFFKLK